MLGKPSDRLYILPVKYHNAPFALDAFDHHGGDILVFESLFKLGLVSRRHILKAGCKGSEKLVIMLLTGGGKGGYCSSVEAVFKGYNYRVFNAFFVACIFSRRFYGTFVAFGTGV